MIRARHPEKPKLVVIGNGMAGARLVEEVLALAPDAFDVTVFGDEPYGNYNRILLSNVLNGTQDAKEVFLNPLEWYETNGVTLHAGKRVTAIDRKKKVVSADGVEEPYDVLVFATGSRPFVPPLEGELLATVGTALGAGREAALDRVALRRRLPWIAIEADAPLTLNLDGEPVEAIAFRIDCVPGRLRMHLPVDCPLRADAARVAA